MGNHAVRGNPVPTVFSHPVIRMVLVASAALLGACSLLDSKVSDSAAKAIQMAWPAPPDSPRFIYEAQLRNHTDISRQSTEDRIRKWATGDRAAQVGLAYSKPYDLAARNGLVYVADRPRQAVVVFDIPHGKVFQMGVREPNRVKAPVSLAVDAEKRVYVLDAKLKQVMVFDFLGLFLFSVGTPDDLVKPVAVTASPDGKRIYIVDRGSIGSNDHKVIAYTADGHEVFRIAARGAAPGQLNIPLDAVVTLDGKLHVLDSGNFRVQSFDAHGKLVSTFGTLGTGLGQFSRPRSIAADAEGNLYVSDASFNNVQIFNSAGELLMWLGRPGMTNLPGMYTLIGAVTVDETGRLYVADQYQPKIEVFRKVAADSPSPQAHASPALAGPLAMR